ncbi:MAG: riboflavin synthase [Gloeomargarita sp. GMQP_bins_120]
MFTGLVQALGRVRRCSGHCLEITTNMACFPDLAVGDSMAVDGVCLTVTAYDPQGFTAATSPETLRRSCLGQREWVNVEAALRVGQKLGGHFVTGHVDGVGYLQDKQAVGSEFWEMAFTAPPEVARYLVPKGSIAVNGVSLTIANLQGTTFRVAVIPLTYQHTNLQYLRPGDPVNLEADLLGKYVERFLQPWSVPAPLTAEFLAQHGFV